MAKNLSQSSLWKRGVLAAMALLLSGCTLPESLTDLTPMREAAYASLKVEEMGLFLYGFWILTLIPLMLLTAKRARESESGGALEYFRGFLLASVVAIAPSVFEFLTLIGKNLFWPAELTYEWIAAQNGWTFPPTGDVNPVTLALAFGLTLEIPNYYKLWEIILGIVVVLLVIVAVNSFSFRPLLMAVVLSSAWLLFPSMLYELIGELGKGRPQNFIDATQASYNADYMIAVAVLYLTMLVAPPAMLILFPSVHERTESATGERSHSGGDMFFVPFPMPGGGDDNESTPGTSGNGNGGGWDPDPDITEPSHGALSEKNIVREGSADQDEVDIRTTTEEEEDGLEGSGNIQDGALEVEDGLEDEDGLQPDPDADNSVVVEEDAVEDEGTVEDEEVIPAETPDSFTQDSEEQDLDEDSFDESALEKNSEIHSDSEPSDLTEGAGDLDVVAETGLHQEVEVKEYPHDDVPVKAAPEKPDERLVETEGDEEDVLRDAPTPRVQAVREPESEVIDLSLPDFSRYTHGVEVEEPEEEVTP